MNRNEKLYKALERVVDLDAVRENRFDAAKSKVAGFMDLNFDYLHGNELSARIALSHYYRQNGDMIADPDMEILVRFDRKEAEALTFQDIFGYSRISNKLTFRLSCDDFLVVFCQRLLLLLLENFLNSEF